MESFNNGQMSLLSEVQCKIIWVEFLLKLRIKNTTLQKCQETKCSLFLDNEVWLD